MPMTARAIQLSFLFIAHAAALAPAIPAMPSATAAYTMAPAPIMSPPVPLLIVAMNKMLPTNVTTGIASDTGPQKTGTFNSKFFGLRSYMFVQLD